jgi:hypothetical protein
MAQPDSAVSAALSVFQEEFAALRKLNDITLCLAWETAGRRAHDHWVWTERYGNATDWNASRNKLHSFIGACDGCGCPFIGAAHR